jgi:hypothetical protein
VVPKFEVQLVCNFGRTDISESAAPKEKNQVSVFTEIKEIFSRKYEVFTKDIN